MNSTERTDATPMRRLNEMCRDFRGQKVAIWCIKYVYRGVVAEVGQDFIILHPAMIVLVTGASQGEAVEDEEEISGPLAISLAAVEIIFQPPWCFAPIPGEE